MAAAMSVMEGVEDPDLQQIFAALDPRLARCCCVIAPAIEEVCETPPRPMGCRTRRSGRVARRTAGARVAGDGAVLAA
jgi:hypothetical protein